MITIHTVYLDPTLGAEWLFEAMRAWFIRFTPFIATTLDVVKFSYDRRTAQSDARFVLSVPVQRDRAPSLQKELQTRFPDAVLDLLVYEEAGELALTLNARAAADQRLGVPE